MTDQSDDYVIYGPACCSEHRAAPCIRSRGGNAEAGVLMPAVEGREPPEGVEVVRLEHVGKGVARVAEVISGPPMVNSEAFRNNWDSIFGHKQPVGEA